MSATVFDLFQNRKVVDLTDGEERKVSVYLTKLTYLQRQQADELYRDLVRKQRKSANLLDIKDRLSKFTKEQIIDQVADMGIMMFTRGVAQACNLPKEESDKLTDEEIHKKYKEHKLAQLGSWSEDKILDLAAKLFADYSLLQAAMEEWWVYCVALTTEDESGNRVFSTSPEDKNYIKNLRVETLALLTKEYREFNSVDANEVVSKLAADVNFLALLT